jgi:hypothetical protein
MVTAGQPSTSPPDTNGVEKDGVLSLLRGTSASDAHE